MSNYAPADLASDKLIARAILNSNDFTIHESEVWKNTNGVDYTDVHLVKGDTGDWYIVERDSAMGHYEITRHPEESDARALYEGYAQSLIERRAEDWSNQ